VRLYFDANTVIQIVEQSDAAATPFADVLAGAVQRGLAILTSELTLAEVLIKPLRDQDFNLIVGYNNLLSGGNSGEIHTIPVSREILGRAARIRNRKQSIKLPDAIHIATAEHTGCSYIFTGDKGFVGATEIAICNSQDRDIAGFIEMLS
jgi:predicted nucleic acid-binding protein